MSAADVLDGRDILADLRARGLTIRLREDGQPSVGPRQLVDDADRALLKAHRHLVIAALRWKATAEEVAS